jgi:ADP-heptose:LPS heptosyltransferase/predicted SAM-dependent methyltransferase
MVWRAEDPQGHESEKIKWEIVEYTRGRGLDLGCGNYKPFEHFVGVDNGDHCKKFGWSSAANFHVDTCEKLDLFASAGMDFVFSSHLLEHIENYQEALKEWWRIIKPQGYLVLYLPHKNFYPNIGQPGANPEHMHDFLPDDIINVMKGLGGWDLVRCEDRNEGREYSFFMVYRKASSAKQTYSYLNCPPDKTCAVVRYGGIGDMIQTSSIFPALKEQGYHLTMYTTPAGKNILQEDPHIDAWHIQDTDQVQNGQLCDFWDYHKAKFDKWINLSGSIEHTLLAQPGSPTANLPHEVRHSLQDRNYLEFTHDIAGLPHVFHQKVYLAPHEVAWARKERKAITDRPLVFFSLSGSSVHKVYPHMDEVISRIVKTTDMDVILMGDEPCRILEQGWEESKRVHCRSGKYAIRESLALAAQCELIIGPETGLLNAYGLESIPKVLFLSHSSHENLTKHWHNTIALAPKGVDCYPCHALHYSFATCRERLNDGGSRTGVAACAWAISADDVVAAINKAIEWRQAA